MNYPKLESPAISTRISYLTWIFLAAYLLTSTILPTTTTAEIDVPLRILMTNDDGIEKVEQRMYPVAQELRRFAEVFIVVANQDRSGSSNFMSLSRKVTLESRIEYVSEAGDGLHRLEIHVVDGYPADCVVLGIRGIMSSDPPDLVIAGPNGGPNLADDWFGSGTIGAARTAAYMGVPAIAVSGLNSRLPEQVDALSKWIAELAQSELVLSLPDQIYLTVGLPRVDPSQIAGIRVAHRARRIEALFFQLLEEIPDTEDDDEISSIWVARHKEHSTSPAADSDIALYSQNYIVVTPMRADEHDLSFLDKLSRSLDCLPAWAPSRARLDR